MSADFINATIGGLLIGISSILMLSLLGKITGISGIISQGLLRLSDSNDKEAWRWLFLLGLLVGPIICHSIFNLPIPESSNAGLRMAAIAGLLVGFGSKFGSGCTSGHGICGIGRLSKRSIFATVIFMAAAMVTVYLNNTL